MMLIGSKGYFVNVGWYFMGLKKKIERIKTEYEWFHGFLPWQPTDEEKELGFLARACFDESIQSEELC